MVKDLTVLLDRLICRVLGHVPERANIVIRDTPWARPQCWRCGKRLARK